MIVSMAMQVDTTSFPGRLQNSFGQLGAYVVPLLGGLVILFAGYLLASLLRRLTLRLLRRVKLNVALERGGVMEAVERGGAHFDPTLVLAHIVFWLVMFAVLLVAADAVGLESLATVFSAPPFPDSPPIQWWLITSRPPIIWGSPLVSLRY